MPTFKAFFQHSTLFLNCYNQMVYCKALKSKGKEDVIQALKEITKSSGIFSEYQTDLEMHYIYDYVTQELHSYLHLRERKKCAYVS